MITLHPSYLQRGQMHLYPYVRNDFKRFGEMAFGLRPDFVPYEQIVDPTLTQALDYLSDIHENSTETCLDIETVGREKITCIGWTKNKDSAISVSFRHKGLKNRWQKHEQLMLIEVMRKIYAKPGLVKIGQNIFRYDMHWLLAFLGFPREPLFDTLLAHHLVHPDARHDLGFIVSNYTDMPYHKDEVKDWEQKERLARTDIYQRALYPFR